MTGLWTALTAMPRCFTRLKVSVSKMAKKVFKPSNTHRQCKHCCVVEDEFLSIKGEPIMGECIYSRSRFLLNETIECEEFKN